MSRSTSFRRLEQRLTHELGVSVRIDWDHARGGERRRGNGGKTTTVWAVEWADGPTVQTMRGHVDRIASAHRVPRLDIDGLRYVRIAQDVTLLTLAIQYRLDHPQSELSAATVDYVVFPDVEYPERTAGQRQHAISALYGACDGDVVRAIELVNQQRVVTLEEWLDTITNPPTNVVPLGLRRRRNPAEES